MRAWMAFLGMLPACGFQSSPASNGDASTDAPSDAFPVPFGSIITVKFNSPSDVPTTPPTLTADVNTDTSPLCDKHNDQAEKYCVIAGSSITIANGTTLRAHGIKPLVLLATTTFDLEGVIDVSSTHGDPKLGAGAKPQGSCLATTAATGHSGGYGGSFAGMGGMGSTPVSTTGEAAGVPAPAITLPMVLRGGCPGGDGAGNAGMSGTGGSGGGAVAIIAATSIHLNGQINASGAGGLGGTENGSGGGGGGSGGMIVLDAPLIDAGVGPNVWIYANGGGGGQGGTGTGAGSGAGDDGMESPNPATQAPAGGNATLSGGRGGDGSAGPSKKDGDPAMTAVNSGDGGGGGGAAGFIRSPAVAGAVFAPAPISP